LADLGINTIKEETPVLTPIYLHSSNQVRLALGRCTKNENLYYHFCILHVVVFQNGGWFIVIGQELVISWQPLLTCCHLRKYSVTMF
jgi:hypothetical protein